MAAHDRIDARDGLPDELLTDLREADVVVIAPKDHHMAVVRLEIGQRVRVAILPCAVHLLHGHSVAQEQPLVIADAQHDLLWRKVIDALHSGDLATVEWMLGWGAVSVAITVGPLPPARKWTLGDYQRLTAPLARLDAWPDLRPTTTSPMRSLSLGFTMQRRRWRVGQPTWVWARRPDR